MTTNAQVETSTVLQFNRQSKVTDDKEFSENSETFCVKYGGRRYEISGFLKHHPGGRQALKAYRGLALDQALAQVPHSEAAYHLFQDFALNNERAYEDVENLIDWTAPLLAQVGSLRDRYWEWVNLPVNRSIRLFKSDFLEMLTITPWYLVPIVWIPISIYFLYFGIATSVSGPIERSIHTVTFAFLWGVLLWTFIEYVLHRKLFHLRPRDDSKILISLHFLLHGLHHKAPFDSRRLVFPPVAAMIITFVLYNLYKAIFPGVMTDIVASGAMTGYLCYDLIHYYLHYGAPTANTYLYNLKRYHNYHHFSHHEQGFGISSTLWDYVFGSLIVLRQLKKAIIW